MEDKSRSVINPKGMKVILIDEYKKHILFRHPEVLPYSEIILPAVEKPDETYSDERGGLHALKHIDDDHFLVVIYEVEENEDEGFIRTAYIINKRRKNRRYSELRSTKQQSST